MEVNLLSGALGAEVYGISLKDSSEKNWKLIKNYTFHYSLMLYLWPHAFFTCAPCFASVV